jgi:RNA polymerase sigma-54 factor
VSRITTNKFVSTPFGIYELKFFFSSGLGKDGGGQMASESVKNIIKKLISDENPQKPLSDKGIVELLNEKLQVNIARRTVAKYREAMNIPSSTKRKKVF